MKLFIHLLWPFVLMLATAQMKRWRMSSVSFAQEEQFIAKKILFDIHSPMEREQITLLTNRWVGWEMEEVDRERDRQWREEIHFFTAKSLHSIIIDSLSEHKWQEGVHWAPAHQPWSRRIHFLISSTSLQSCQRSELLLKTWCKLLRCLTSWVAFFVTGEMAKAKSMQMMY